ncbi:transmembrane signal receptor [Lithospermum erythrorhizon]|uniref:Transmembrane signal receptor n=1 Tax=Lithospermum erythrorhizon TaxID=34254 RepID=A0AAV3RPM4_LITER
MARGVLSISCHHPLILLALLVLNVVVTFSINQSSDSQNLIKFKNSLENNGSLSGWDASKEICSGDNSNWGNTIICDSGSVWGIKLENMGLKGTINIDALHEVKTLRSISLIKNKFDGPLPNFKKIGTLRALYISHNNFQGDIPSVAFDGMNSLKKLYIGSNKFTGKIPMSLITLPKLQELYLENNQFSGEIPAFSPGTVKIFNVANNKLEGQIPSALNFFNKASFAGNKGLCGKPLDSCTMSFVAKLSIATITILTITCFAAISALVVVIIILLRRNRTNHYDHGRRGIIARDPTHFALPDLNRLERGSSSEITPITKRSPENENVKLSFLRDDRPTFDMNDLLKASAETLGNGVCGATYKAAIVAGPTMVVKRYKHMNNVDKVEFCDHMRRVGRLDHKNLLPFVAFYYRKEEKLLVFDHVDNDSLAVYLQGNGSGRPTGLDWQTRLKIIKGIARGLMYLHIELPNLVVPHGHLKSSNVLLNKVTMEPILTDYALVPLINQEQHYLTAYRSPEFQQTGRISKKTDVYGLGMLILEILTGKVPSPSWIESIAGTVFNPDIIDMDIPGKRGYESDMIKVLKIGLKCCEFDIEKRWDMIEAVEVIEGIKDKENNMDDDFYSVRGSP